MTGWKPAPHLEQCMVTIQELLAFRLGALNQFVLVATIFGAFAMSGVVALISSSERSRLREFLFILLTFASLAFMVATLIGTFLLPYASRTSTLSNSVTKTMLGLYTLGVGSALIGTLLMAMSLAAMGFLISKKAGVLAIVGTMIGTVVFVGAVMQFASAMRGS